MDDHTRKKKRLDWITLIVSGGLLVLFVIASILNEKLVGQWISESFFFCSKVFWCLLASVTARDVCHWIDTSF